MTYIKIILTGFNAFSDLRTGFKVKVKTLCILCPFFLASKVYYITKCTRNLETLGNRGCRYYVKCVAIE